MQVVGHCATSHMRAASAIVLVYLVGLQTVQTREVFNVARLNVEAGAVPGTANATLSEASLDEGSTVVRAFGGDGRELPFLFDQQHFRAAHIHFPHPGYK